MPLVATSSRRRWIMVLLLSLAVAGGVIRHYADPASSLHDLGTLLLVLWLPVVGNLIGWLIRQIPRRPPPALPDFAPDAPFAPHLQLELEPVPLPDGWLAGLPEGWRKGTLLAGPRGYTVRLREPLAQLLAGDGARTVEVELLRPEVGLPELPPGTAIHWVVGSTAVARGRVTATLG